MELAAGVQAAPESTKLRPPARPSGTSAAERLAHLLVLSYHGRTLNAMPSLFQSLTHPQCVHSDYIFIYDEYRRLEQFPQLTLARASLNNIVLHRAMPRNFRTVARMPLLNSLSLPNPRRFRASKCLRACQFSISRRYLSVPFPRFRDEATILYIAPFENAVQQLGHVLCTYFQPAAIV